MKVDMRTDRNIYFWDFCVQAGMVFGYDEQDRPFVTNGVIHDGMGKFRDYSRINIRFYEHGKWILRHISERHAPRLWQKIMNKVDKRTRIQAESAQTLHEKTRIKSARSVQYQSTEQIRLNKRINSLAAGYAIPKHDKGVIDVHVQTDWHGNLRQYMSHYETTMPLDKTVLA